MNTTLTIVIIVQYLPSLIIVIMNTSKKRVSKFPLSKKSKRQLRRLRKNDLNHSSLHADTELIILTNDLDESSSTLLSPSSASNDLNLQYNQNFRSTNNFLIPNNDTIINNQTYTIDDSKYFSNSSASLPTIYLTMNIVLII